MSLKATAVTFIIVGLAHQLGAFRLNPLQDHVNTTVAGFNHTLKEFGGFSVNSTKGALHGFDTLRNTSEWRLSVGPNFKAISQNTTLPKLSVLYEKANSSMGPFKSVGQLLVKLGDAPLNLTLNATNLGGERCHLQVQIRADNITAQNVHVETSRLGALGGTFQGIRPLWNNVTATLALNYNETLPLKLSGLVQRDLSRKVDMDALCKQIEASSPTKFPEPKF